MPEINGNKKLLIITYYWPPSGGAGVQRVLKFAKYLPGFNVTPIVLTVDQHVASYPIKDESLLKDVKADILVHRTKSFEPLNIIGKIFGKEKIPHAGFANHKKEKFSSKVLRFIRGNFFIPDARKGWVKYAVKEANKIIEHEKITSVLISSPPHSSQLIGLKLKKKYPHLNWIADMRDPWTDIYYYNDLLHTHAAKQKDSRLELDVLNTADKIIVVSDELKRLFASKNIAASKIHVIPNGFDEDDFTAEAIEAKSNDFIITYTGTIAETYKPSIVFQAIKELASEINEKKIKLRFIGSSSSAIKNEINACGIDSVVEYISYVKHTEAINYMLQSDCLLLVIPDVKNAGGILTGKLFEYLATQKPILGIGPKNGDAAKIIRECEAGELFERTEKERIKLFLKELLKKERPQNKSEMYKKYSRKLLTKELSNLIK